MKVCTLDCVLSRVAYHMDQVLDLALNLINSFHVVQALIDILSFLDLKLEVILAKLVALHLHKQLRSGIEESYQQDDLNEDLGAILNHLVIQWLFRVSGSTHSSRLSTNCFVEVVSCILILSAHLFKVVVSYGSVQQIMLVNQPNDCQIHSMLIKLAEQLIGIFNTLWVLLKIFLKHMELLCLFWRHYSWLCRRELASRDLCYNCRPSLKQKLPVVRSCLCLLHPLNVVES